jgi:hypothetical protein
MDEEYKRELEHLHQTDVKICSKMKRLKSKDPLLKHAFELQRQKAKESFEDSLTHLPPLEGGFGDGEDSAYMAICEFPVPASEVPAKPLRYCEDDDGFEDMHEVVTGQDTKPCSFCGTEVRNFGDVAISNWETMTAASETAICQSGINFGGKTENNWQISAHFLHPATMFLTKPPTFVRHQQKLCPTNNGETFEFEQKGFEQRQFKA